jgi:hypothetical protein
MVKFFNSSAMAMNVVVTPHQPVCLYSAAGREGEPPYRSHWLSGGPSGVRNIIIVFLGNELREGVFWTFGIPKTSCFSRIELITKNDLAPRRGYYWGSSPPKVLKAKTPLARQYKVRCDMKV